MKHSLIALVVLAMSSSAFALGDATYNSGGSAIAAPVANGGSVLGSGNSANANTNTNVLGQQQGQGQAQGQTAIGVGLGGAGGGGGASSSSSGSSSTSGATSNSGGNTMSQVGGAQTSTQANAVTVTGDTVTYQAARIPVSTAYAAPLAASNGTCLGSKSGGFSVAGLSASAAGTHLDEGCDTRYDAQALAQAGFAAAAQARLCMKAEIAQAMEIAGTPCKTSKRAAAPVTKTAAIGGGSSDAPAAVSGYTGNDPYVLKRLAR